MPAPRHPNPPEECAQCGEDIPHNARACPHCGADERTGWRENSIYDGLDLPDTAEDIDESAHHSSRQGNQAGLRWYWSATLIVVLLILGLSALGLR
jgi:predicted nucleic acid-binding Zn ribbon protein